MSPEDFADAEMARHNRSLHDDHDASDVWCDCDEPGCPYGHDDCDCPHACERHARHMCVDCLEISNAPMVSLDCGERIHPACLQKMIDDGEFTRDDLADFADELAAHGITFPEAPSEAAAE